MSEKDTVGRKIDNQAGKDKGSVSCPQNSYLGSKDQIVSQRIANLGLFYSKLNKIVYSYLLLSVFITIFNVGDLDVSKFIVYLVGKVTPSLQKLDTNGNNNSYFIIAISWIIVFLSPAALYKNIIKKPFCTSISFAPNNSIFVRFLSLIIFIICFGVLYISIPSVDSGRFNKFAYSLVSSGGIASSIYGVIVIAAFMFTLILLVTFIVEFFEFIGKK